MDEEYTQSDISKEVERLMDEEGFEFGEAVKEAMAQGYKNGGLMIAIKNLAQGGMTYGDKTYHQYHDQYVPPDTEAVEYAYGGGVGSMMQPKRGLVNEPGGYAGRTLGDILEHGYFMRDERLAGPDDGSYDIGNIIERFSKGIELPEEMSDEDRGDVSSVEEIFERDTPLTEGIFGLSEGFTLSPITLLRRYLANKELENKVDYADGGRVGLFMGGSPLTGEALAIYNSMNAYGYTDQEIADRLSGLNLYDPNTPTPPPPPSTTPPSNTRPEDGGNGGGQIRPEDKTTRDTLIDMGIKAADDDKGSLMLDEIISKTTPGLEIPDRNRGMEDNEDFIDRGNPLNDSRVVSEEMGLVGGIPDRNRGQITSTPTGGITTIGGPNMRDIAGPSTTVDESISIKDLSKPSNIGDFEITGAPDLTNQTGIISDLSNIGIAKNPDVEDPFDGKYSPSFEEKKTAEGILAGLLDKAANFGLSDLKTMGTNFSINKALQTLGFANIPSFLGTKAITLGIDYFKNKQVQKEIEKQAAATQNRKETREIQARIDAAEKKRQEDIVKQAATAAAQKAAREGKAYDYSGRSNKQGTHTSTISKEKAQDNQDRGRGNTGSTKSSSKSSGRSQSSRGGGADMGGGGRNSSDRGGGFGGLGFSDIRLKDNIELVGKSKSDINIYNFTYLNDPTVYQGVMAHEVPWASVKHNSGYLMVDYNKVDVDFKSIR